MLHALLRQNFVNVNVKIKLLKKSFVVPSHYEAYAGLKIMQ